MPDNDTTEPAKPRWTTGQGLGFLVALPGLIITVLGVASMLVSVLAITDKDDALVGLLFSGGVAVVGLIAAVPGLIVFYRCARP